MLHLLKNKTVLLRFGNAPHHLTVDAEEYLTDIGCEVVKGTANTCDKFDTIVMLVKDPKNLDTYAQSATKKLSLLGAGPKYSRLLENFTKLHTPNDPRPIVAMGQFDGKWRISEVYPHIDNDFENGWVYMVKPTWYTPPQKLKKVAFVRVSSNPEDIPHYNKFKDYLRENYWFEEVPSNTEDCIIMPFITGNILHSSTARFTCATGTTGSATPYQFVKGIENNYSVCMHPRFNSFMCFPIHNPVLEGSTGIVNFSGNAMEVLGIDSVANQLKLFKTEPVRVKRENPFTKLKQKPKTPVEVFPKKELEAQIKRLNLLLVRRGRRLR